MFEAIRYNLSNLTNLSGRDTRSTFWFYVLFLAIIQVVASFTLSIIAGGAMMADAFQSARAGMNEAAVSQQIVGHMGSMIRVSMWGSVVISILMTVLLAASFTRRLHDSDKPGWIAGLVVGFQLVSLALTISMIGEMVALVTAIKPDDSEAMREAMLAKQGKYALSGLLGWIPVLAVVVFGVWPSTDGDNRYGPEPDHI
jgi:Predicted membrane protein